MTGAYSPVWLALAAILAAILTAVGLAFLVTWLVGGTVGTRIAKRRDRREFALDGAQDFADPEVRTWGDVLRTHDLETSTRMLHERWRKTGRWPQVDEPWSDPNDEVTKPTNCGQFGSYYGPCGGCDVCLEGQRAYYEMLEREEAKAKLRELEITELNKPTPPMTDAERDRVTVDLNAALRKALNDPGKLIQLREELRQLPEFSKPAKHGRVRRHNLDGAITHGCECGGLWPCVWLVGRVWEGAE